MKLPKSIRCGSKCGSNKNAEFHRARSSCQDRSVGSDAKESLFNPPPNSVSGHSPGHFVTQATSALATATLAWTEPDHRLRHGTLFQRDHTKLGGFDSRTKNHHGMHICKPKTASPLVFQPVSGSMSMSLGCLWPPFEVGRWEMVTMSSEQNVEGMT